jgi:hypothetical protein
VLAAGREELRKALAEIVRETIARGWVDARKVEGWLEKLERGLTLMEGWPKYHVRLSSSGALEVKYQSTSPDSIEQEAQRFREMGLVEGVHFTVKMPEGAATATLGSSGRAWSAPPGSPYAARENSRSWRLNLWSTYSEGRRRLGLAKRSPKKPKRS